MKYRIIGTLIILVILGALFVVTNDDNQVHPTGSSQQVDPNAGALQGLKIN
jgi:hypothetical protein